MAYDFIPEWYGPQSDRSYFADIARVHLAHVRLEDAPIASARAAYVRDEIEVDEFERRVEMALRLSERAI